MAGALKVSVLGTRMELIRCDIWKAQKNVFIIVDDKIRSICYVTFSFFTALAELAQQLKSVYPVLNDCCCLTLFILLLKSQLSEGTLIKTEPDSRQGKQTTF